MAAIIIGGGVALHDLYKSHKKKKAAKKADEALGQGQADLQTENQRRFDYIQAQQNPFDDSNAQHSSLGAPPAYDAVVTSKSRATALEQRRRLSGEAAQDQNITHGGDQPSTLRRSSAEEGSSENLVHPAYRQSAHQS